MKMLISDKKKFIFIHIPKCAGHTIMYFLRSQVQDSSEYFNNFLHPKWSVIKRNIGNKKWNSYFKFTFIRNPWDKMVSQYHYFNRSNKSGKIADKAKKQNFRQWIYNSQYERMWRFDVRHHTYICNKNLDPQVDFIGRVDNINEDYKKVCDILDIKYNKPKKTNMSKHDNYHKYYDNKTKKIVDELFKNDIELFNFKY